MKKAFTLMELLVVVAIMGLLGTAAANGYNSLVRGMRERSAVTAASAVLRAASERARVDRVPTAVFCYNRLVKVPTSEENGVVVGVMTAIRKSGRITFARGDMLYDEFADLDHCYESEEEKSELSKGGGIRLFRFSGLNMNDMEYSIVSDRVLVDDAQMVTVFSGGAGGSQETNLTVCAFYNMKKSAKEPSWKSGDAYAFEFNEILLPEGIIFGSTAPTDATKDELIKTIVFDPESDNVETVELNLTKPDASGYPKQFKKVGKATSDSDEAI